MDDIKRDRLIKRLSELPDDALISLDEFFDGNDDEGSIGCNLISHPGMAIFRETLQKVASRTDVQNVLVKIAEVDPGFGSWPFTDTIYVVGNISQAQLQGDLAVLEPDEVEPVTEHLPAALVDFAGQVFFVWWD